MAVLGSEKVGIFFAILLFRVFRDAVNPHKYWLFCGQTGRRHLFCMVNTSKSLETMRFLGIFLFAKSYPFFPLTTF